MSEAMPKLPTVPWEYIEVVKTDIRDKGDTIGFEFQFAAPVNDEKIKECWKDMGSTVPKTIIAKLHDKGWVSPDGMKAFVRLSGSGQSSAGGKTWTFLYRNHEEPTPSNP